jgi:hypothetical protein
MKPADITQTVIHYLAKNSENLQGSMPDEMYFLVRGSTISEYSRADPRITIGTAIDVLADTIENGRFFGWYVSKAVNQTTNCNNAELVPLNDKDRIKGTFEVKLSDGGLFIAAERVNPKKYLDVLRTSNGFKQSASLLGVEGDLEKIASILYTSN